MTNSYSFLGLPQEQWEFINSFSGWLAALGTLAAVLLSLWLALRAGVPRGRLWANIMVVLVPGQPMSSGFLSIKLTNMGDRPFNVTGIGWRVGLPLFRRHLMQLDPVPPIGVPNAPLPVSLAPGESASWNIDLTHPYGDQTWGAYFASKAISKIPCLDLMTLRVQAFTSTNHTFMAKPSPDVLKEIREGLTHRRENAGESPSSRKSVK